ncbi:SDR family NAD(P)-dependent oxidoreductase [Jiangella asiatica]|uniref:SDR family oxidoreductase n=1 Tax=Jiangella asiatica TaxID=2530372 RepID=A0A4V6PFG1_9ACTN|nr:SDR family oxidoreductase [Jiangella asiatica]TDE03108.1 SDR family oxidoreductase [Jiangella asiatica]
MSRDLAGRSALVTGGGTGIGRGIALALAAAGADVALTYHNHDGEQVAAEIRSAGQRSRAFALDALDSRDVDRVVDAAAAELGRLDILVNNVGGLVARQDGATMSDEHWHRVIDINLSSVMYATRAVLRHLPDGGRVVTISSLAAHHGGGAGAAAYAAAKAGVHGLSRSLAKELGPRGITVNVVAPGLILQTPFHETFTPVEAQQAAVAATPLARAGVPADVAGAVVYLASDRASFVTGAVLDVNGGTYFV